jgi:CO/xanthine dehydrogenase Mo-binding subunit
VSEEIVGTSVPRRDSPAKLTGQARYADDLVLPRMLHAAATRSPYARARIISIDTAPALAIRGVRAVMTAQDIPGSNLVGPVVKDQPVIAGDLVSFHGEAVAIVAADTRDLAVEAAEAVVVVYEPLPPITDPYDAMSDSAPQLRAKGNVAHTTRLRHGDVEAGFAASDVIVEGDFRTQLIEHAYLEPESSVSVLEPDGTISVYASTQYTHYDRDEVARTLGVPFARVRVVQMVTGGGFGGKFGSPMTQCQSALLAWRTRRPVKMTWSRAESIATSPKRHPFRVHTKIGAKADGTLQAIQVRIVSDTGAYLVTGNSVLGRATTHCSGPYVVPNVQADGTAMYTNNPPAGAMRGYGVPQVCLATEQLLDELAHRLGVDPVALRLQNAFKVGESTPTGQVLNESVSIREALELARDAAEGFREDIAAAPKGRRRGVGVAAAWHGVASSRKPSEGTAIINVAKDGSVSVNCGAVDIGQGSDTVMAQIAAEELHVPVDRVSVSTTDSSVTPDNEATTGNRVTYISGNATYRAAVDARRQILEMASEDLEVAVADLVLRNGVVSVVGSPDRRRTVGQLVLDRGRQGITATGSFIASTTGLDPHTMQGIPHDAFGMCAHAALVEVEMDTGKVRVLRYASFNDAGRAINPDACIGQTTGGAVMGIGYGLFEEVHTGDGRVLNPDFTTYMLPTAVDSPAVEVGTLESPSANGPYGAKGIGELVLNPVAATIMSAIRDATGVMITRLPATPERVYTAIQEAAGRSADSRW